MEIFAIHMQIKCVMATLKEKLQTMLQATDEQGTPDSAPEAGNETANPQTPTDMKAQFGNLKADIASTPRKYFLFVFASFLILYALFGDYGIVQRLRLEYHYHSLQNQLAEENERTKQLKLAIKQAKEPQEIERIAREKYNLTKDGETVYIIK